MLNGERLTELEAESEVLVAQGDLQRRMLQMDALSMQKQWGWLGNLGQSFHRTSPWVLAASSLLGFLAFRKSRHLLRWLPAALTVWRLARQFFGPRS